VQVTVPKKKPEDPDTKTVHRDVDFAVDLSTHELKAPLSPKLARNENTENLTIELRRGNPTSYPFFVMGSKGEIDPDKFEVKQIELFQLAGTIEVPVFRIGKPLTAPPVAVKKPTSPP
jgi:hypothetical protein